CLCFAFSVAPPPLHSFPTRRSSDLHALAIGEPTLAIEVTRLLARAAHAREARRVDRGVALEVAGVLRVEPLRDHRAHVGVEVLRSEEHTSELQSRENLVCRLLLEKK